MMKILNVNCRLLAVLLLLVLEACTDYASKMEDDFEEWKAAQSQLDEGVVPESNGSEKIEPVERSSSSYRSLEPGSVYDFSANTLKDLRDNQIYRTVTIGSQIWMAENLNYKVAESYCYEDSISNCDKYGRLYAWGIAMDSVGKWSKNGRDCGYDNTCSPTYPVRGVCPEGWHLPTKDEFEELFSAVGGQAMAGKALKSDSGWHHDGHGSDAYSFTALPAGVQERRGKDWGKGDDAFFWSSTEYDHDYAYKMYLSFNNDSVLLDEGYKSFMFSVRCVKDENSSSITPQSSSSRTRVSSSSVKSSSSAPSSSSEIKLETLTDERDGQTYKIVTIGSQTWMAENLNYETDNSYCYNDSPSNCTKYGRLYTWNAAKMACPSGWHLPALVEFDTLYVAVGGKSSAGAALKSASGWIVDEECKGSEKCVSDYKDVYLFTVLPAGVRRNGTYGGEGGDARFWTSSEYSSDDAFLTYMESYYNEANDYYDSKDAGYSVRCVKGESLSGDTPQSSSSATSVSSSNVPEGYVDPSTVVTGSVTDERDGQTYRTVTIGTQTWMAQNLNYETANSYCYVDSPSNCTKYGRLYTWAAAMDSAGTWSMNGKGCGYDTVCSPTYPVRGVCPEGWHLPAYSEFVILLDAVGGQFTAGRMLKSTSEWSNDENGTDAYAFAAFPVGSRDSDGGYDRNGSYVGFWSSSEDNDYYAYHLNLNHLNEDVHIDSYKNYGISVRCVKD